MRGSIARRAPHRCSKKKNLQGKCRHMSDIMCVIEQYVYDMRQPAAEAPEGGLPGKLLSAAAWPDAGVLPMRGKGVVYPGDAADPPV